MKVVKQEKIFYYLDAPRIRQIAPIECRRGDGESAQQRGVPCFLAGDLRANEQVNRKHSKTFSKRKLQCF